MAAPGSSGSLIQVAAIRQAYLAAIGLGGVSLMGGVSLRGGGKKGESRLHHHRLPYPR